MLTKENVEANRLRLEVDVNDLQGYDAEVHRKWVYIEPTGLLVLPVCHVVVTSTKAPLRNSHLC